LYLKPLVGIPDEIRGESIACYIVPTDNSIDTRGLSDQLIKLIEKILDNLQNLNKSDL
jgi:acyl-coenzyme A synthetase/AMP-(fatty) acid ligase